MKRVLYKGAVYVAASDNGTDSLAGWLEERGVEIELRFKKPRWSLVITGPKNTVSTNGNGLQDVLSKGCRLFGRVSA